MGIEWKYLNWTLPLPFNEGKCTICNIDKDQVIITILQNQRQCTLLRLNVLNWELLSVGIIEEDDEVLQIFSVQGAVYKWSARGNFYRLVCTTSSGCESGSAVFGLSSSGSSVTESYSWLKISSVDLGKIVCLTELVNGFAAICYCNGIFYLKIVEIKEKPIVKTSVRLPLIAGTEDTWFITSFEPGSLCAQFIKFLCSEQALVLLNLVVIVSPNGYIYIFPIVPKSHFTEPTPIHFDNGSVVSIDVTPCKKALVFIYQSGKVVFARYKPETKEIHYRKHYLLTEVKNFSLYKYETQFGLVWSDGFITYFTGFIDITQFNFNHFETPLRGITSFFQIGKDILALNINGCYYKISATSEEPVLQHENNCSLENISQIGAEIDTVQNEITFANSCCEALLSEQIDSSQIILKVVGNDLNLENLSTNVFRKGIWAIRIESCADSLNLVKNFPLINDLTPSTTLTYPLNYFISPGCKKIVVSIVGEISKTTRLLLVNLGSVPLPKTDDHVDVKKQLCDKIFSILIDHTS